MAVQTTKTSTEGMEKESVVARGRRGLNSCKFFAYLL